MAISLYDSFTFYSSNEYSPCLLSKYFYTKNSLIYLGPILWNNLPKQIKDCSSLNIFKSKLKDYLLASYM